MTGVRAPTWLWLLAWGLQAAIAVGQPSGPPGPRPGGGGAPGGPPPRVIQGPFTATVKFDWPSNGGYRPVAVTLTPSWADPADRVVTVEINRRDWRWYRESTNVNSSVTIPAGSSAPVDFTVYVPDTPRGEGFGARLYVDGEWDPLNQVTSTSSSGRSWNDNRRTLLIVDQKSGALGARAPTVTNAFQQYVTRVEEPAKLPETWLGYSGLDAVVISLNDLASLDTARLAALHRFVANGGRVIVLGGRGAEQRKRVESLLPVGPAASATTTAAAAWTAVDPNSGRTRPAEESPREPAGAALVCECGLGDVVVESAEGFNGLPSGDQSLVARIAALIEAQPTWSRRFGVGDGDRGWFDGLESFQIAGVGEPPVKTFGLLITVFAIVIGPVNYFFLRRRQSLHLLLVTVPASAGAITLGLFLYALMADGLNVRARARSYTEIDQRTGEAICWSRMAYYAGLAPSGGLRFPADTAVMTVASGGNHRRESRRVLTWDEDGQHLESGWLNARTRTQYLTVRARRTEAALQILESSGSAPKIENRLGTRIEKLFLVDSAGQWYTAEALDDGAGATLTPTTKPAALVALRQVYDLNFPRGPDDGRYYPSGPSQSRGDGSLDDNLLESRLTEMGQGATASKRAPGGPRSRDPFASRTYVAIVARSPEVNFGTEVAEEDSYHVIFGRW